MSRCLFFFVLLAPYVCNHILVKLRQLSGHLLGNSCSFGLLNVFMVLVPYCWFVFSRLGFWSGNHFLIAPFPDRCLLVPFKREKEKLLFLFVSRFSVPANSNGYAGTLPPLAGTFT